ncbi:MAG TPA: SpoIID/LytB domain-containing protein [Symbiobacteriaceae bacterium]|nr:SpoIID/LytB domain-containing protein [Symbiobacteriaceae bacterium]
MLPLRRILATGLVAATMLSTASFAVADPDQNDKAIEEGWQAFLDENGKSHAAGAEAEDGFDEWSKHQNVPYAITQLKVGIRYSYTSTGSYSEFASYNHPQVKLTSTLDAFQVIDKATGAVILTAEPTQVVSVSHDGTNFVVTSPDGTVTSVAGPVYFSHTTDNADNTFKVPSIERTNILTYVGRVTPEYRGEFEVARGTATPAGYVNLVNHVELETYLRGNVVNESPASFHVEALKTQAVAARGYAVANIGRFIKVGYPFDIDDSPGSQVYRGKTSEHPKGNDAVNGTKGLVTTYNGKIISAYYSSSMGGYTENVEWSFSGMGSPSQAVPYLIGRYDGPEGTGPDLSTEEGRRAFWAGDQSQAYDSKASAGNSRNRWVFTLNKATLETKINARKAYAVVISGSKTSIGSLAGCNATQWSPSARIVAVRCTGSNAVWEFRTWDQVRSAFPHPTWGTLNNPAFMDNNYDASGNLTGITFTGGGWGHNVGMSQYGANGRGKAGQTFDQILGFYYNGTQIGTHPIVVSNESEEQGPGKLKQEFATVDGHGILELRPEGGIVGLHVTINNKLIALNKADLAESINRIDISEYLTPGLNVIEYHPISTKGSVAASVVIFD